MTAQTPINLVVRVAIGGALLLLLLWGSGADGGGAKEPKKNTNPRVERTASASHGAR